MQRFLQSLLKTELTENQEGFSVSEQEVSSARHHCKPLSCSLTGSLRSGQTGETSEETLEQVWTVQFMTNQTVIEMYVNLAHTVYEIEAKIYFSLYMGNWLHRKVKC